MWEEEKARARRKRQSRKRGQDVAVVGTLESDIKWTCVAVAVQLLNSDTRA